MDRLAPVDLSWPQDTAGKFSTVRSVGVTLSFERYSHVASVVSGVNLERRMVSHDFHASAALGIG